MATFAVIDNTRVINKIVCESKALAEEITRCLCVEYTNEYIEIGMIYDGQNFTSAT